ncbi:hypothetical protein DTO012A7_3365 [Penicillium roqueforti]|nr:hypothetical protein LCP963914a_4184 [Penicillium roqueforti]KAI2704430.1 hypothetical protein CBS147372_2899 [Penicillium roqueforti]KAI2715877.1 hypothetical protein CBS147318_5728 [Penicillium roqueforti]KAI3144568.1 hypothetical protein CBS147325_5328 [Penicillium roqueforti]KAI3155816.1 hypothetical protein CBS147317_5687 [Penicillium roqueforti]
MSDSEAQATGAPGTKTNPGARNKRDWDEACLENPADEDQSTHLPELGTFGIFCPLAPLKDRGGFDEWFTAVEQCLRPTSLSEFNDPEEFINTLAYRYKVTRELKGNIPPPYTALIMMFQELQYLPRFDTIINIWNGELCLLKDPATTITYGDFLAYSSAMQTEARCQATPVSVLHGGWHILNPQIYLMF